MLIGAGCVVQVLGVSPFAPDPYGAAARAGGVQERCGDREQEGALSLRRARVCMRGLSLYIILCYEKSRGGSEDAVELCTEDVFMLNGLG